MTTKKDDFRSHDGKIREVKAAIYYALKDFEIDSIEETERIYKIVEANKGEY